MPDTRRDRADQRWHYPRVMGFATPFDPAQRPAPFTGRGPGLGPADVDACPCGSGHPTASCHFDPRTHRWRLPPFKALLSGPSTGLSVRGCYAELTRDCQGGLSNEHWLSKGLLIEAGDGKVVRIGGLPWQAEGSVNDLPPNRLGSNVLCERHNHALSPLDAHAAYAFKVMDKFYLEQISRADLGGSHIDLLSGEQLERWLLKMLWGATAAFPSVPRIRADADRAMLAEYLFRDGRLPADWGLYTKGLRQGRQSAPGQAISVELQDIDGELWGGSVIVGGVELYFSLGKLSGGGGATVAHRPCAMFLDRSDSANSKVVALSWDNQGTSPGKGVRITYDPALGPPSNSRPDR